MTETETVCDICKVRPATTEVTITKNGKKNRLHVCDIDLEKLQQQSTATTKLNLT